VTGVQTCALPISPKPQNPFLYEDVKAKYADFIINQLNKIT